MRRIYMESLNTFIIEKRNLTELVTEMANYTNRAIMKKLEAIRNLVSISEQSYRRFAATDEKTRNETVEYMRVGHQHCLLFDSFFIVPCCFSSFMDISARKMSI